MKVRAIAILGLFHIVLGGAAFAAPHFGNPLLPGATDSLLHFVHGCHANTQNFSGYYHHHAGQGCNMVTDPDPKLVRDKRGRLCQRFCEGVFPYQVCKLRNCRRPR